MLLIGKHGNYLAVNETQWNANVHVIMHKSTVSEAFSWRFVYQNKKKLHTNRHSAGGRAWGRTCTKRKLVVLVLETIIWLTHCLVELCPRVWFSSTGSLNRPWCGTHAAPNPFPVARLLFVFSAQCFPGVQCFITPPSSLVFTLHVVNVRLGSNWWWGYLFCNFCAKHWG